jgi:hypothetical protein
MFGMSGNGRGGITASERRAGGGREAGGRRARGEREAGDKVHAYLATTHPRTGAPTSPTASLYLR